MTIFKQRDMNASRKTGEVEVHERNRSRPVGTTKVGRNDPCPCGSGKKFKQCCQAKDAGAGSPAAPAFGSSPSIDLKQRLRALSLAAKEQAGAGQWANAIVTYGQIAELDPMNAQALRPRGGMAQQRAASRGGGKLPASRGPAARLKRAATPADRPPPGGGALA